MIPHSPVTLWQAHDYLDGPDGFLQLFLAEVDQLDLTDEQRAALIYLRDCVVAFYRLFHQERGFDLRTRAIAQPDDQLDAMELGCLDRVVRAHRELQSLLNRTPLPVLPYRDRSLIPAQL